MKIQDVRNKFGSLSRAQKLVFLFIAVFLVADLVLGIFVLVRGLRAEVRLFDGADYYEKVLPLDKNARRAFIKDEGYSCFQFSAADKERILAVYAQNSDAALMVSLELMPSKKQAAVIPAADELPLQYGFLSAEDFNAKGKFVTPDYKLTQKITVRGNESAFFKAGAPSKALYISLALPKNDGEGNLVPEGFFVYSALGCKIRGMYLASAEIGFSVTDGYSFYGFGPNGGIIDFSNTSFDFSGASLVFPVSNTARTTMPEFIVGLSAVPEENSTLENAVRTVVSFGGEKISIKNVLPADSVHIPSAALKNPFARAELAENPRLVTSLVMKSLEKQRPEPDADAVRQSEVLVPMKTDPGLILNYKMENWRTLDYEIYEWDRYDKILFFDTRNFEVQGRFFSRLAFFVEKAGYKGNLMSNEFLAKNHGYNAHDYSAESMAAFFNKAAETGFELNYEEELLKRILLANGFFETDGIFVTAHSGGLVSISRQSGAARESLLAHEGWHTIFFRDEEFRNFVSAVYYTCDPDSREFLIDYFKSQPTLGYDTTDEYLMHNEFMAYLMQQPIAAIAPYYLTRANWNSVVTFTPRRARYIRETNARGLEDAAIALNDYVFGKYGIVAGNIALVSR